MKIIDFFEASNREALTEQIAQADWGAARFLAKLLRQGAFHTTLGEGGKLLLLLDGEKIVSFVTLTPKDCIDDDTLFPWLGFFFTYPEYRGHRYGGKLLNHGAEEARKMGYKRVYLATDHIGLYEKYGFVYRENRVDIYGDDSRIYIKELDSISHQL